MLKWNEMTSSQKLLIQSSFSSIFGFKIVSILHFMESIYALSIIHVLTIF